jgi:hypothetical protein
VTRQERLQAAIDQCHAMRPDPLVCIECGNSNVTVEYFAALKDDLPVDRHWAANGVGDYCPVLGGGLAAERRHYDLWNALESTGLLTVGHYGEVAYARRELVSA